MLEGKVVIVTGAGQGIGRHAATTLAEQKAKIVIADLNEEKARKTATDLARQPSPSRSRSMCATKRASSE
jgi:NAD(P)-dependent dehydrogenase (short-subunit alcohol dehydrogenase family)